MEACHFMTLSLSMWHVAIHGAVNTGFKVTSAYVD